MMKRSITMKISASLRWGMLFCGFVIPSLSHGQSWGTEQFLVTWNQDPGTPYPGGQNWVWNNNYNNEPQAGEWSTTMLASAPPAFTAGFGLGLNNIATISGATAMSVFNVDECNLTSAQINGDYIGSTFVFKSPSANMRSLHISRLQFHTDNDQSANYSFHDYYLSLSVKDMTTNGALQDVFKDQYVYSPGGLPNNQLATLNYNINSGTIGNWANVTLIPGHTYEARLYFRLNQCNDYRNKGIDNPTLYVQMVDAVSISGTVYNDWDGSSNGINNLPAAKVAGLNAVLVDANNNVVAVVPVSATNGTYTCTGIDPVASANYKVMLTTANPAIGQAAPGASVLPGGWVSTGENNGAGTGNDGNANGISAPFTPTGNTSNINFGIEQPPIANNDLLTGQVGGTAATVPNILANDTDPNGGALSPDSITLRPSGTNVPGVTYTTDAQGDTVSITVPGQGTWSLNSTNGNVTFTPQAGFTGSPTPISYTVTDAAGFSSNPATITIGYNPPATVSGTIYDDNNGTIGGPGGTPMAGVAVTLYAADGITVLATTTTDANGNYSFPNQVPGNYVVGVTPPAGYQDVSSTDASPTDGRTSVSLGSANATGISFGLNKPPVAVADSLTGQIPGSPATVPNLLANDTDPNGGTLSADSITLRPSVINVSGVTYATDVQGDTVSVTVPGQGTWSLNSSTGALTFTPQSGFFGDPTPITYSVTDNAGLSSTPAAVVIDYIPVPDLTPVIILPINQLGAGASRDFVIQLTELHQAATSGPIAINIAVPAGYTLSFTGTATSIALLAGGQYSLSNSHWNAFTVSASSLNLQSATGFLVPAGGQTTLGFKLTRTTTLTGSRGNITVNIYADPTHTYDSVPANNFYSRIITAN